MNGVTWGVQDAELLLTLTLNVWLAWPVEGSNLGYWLWFHWAPLTTCDLFQLSCGVVAEVETPWWGDGGEGILPYTSLFLTINNTNNSLQPSLSFIPLRSLLSILQMCRLRFWEAKELGQGHTAARHLVLCCSRRLVLTTGAQASPSGTSPLQRPTPFVFPWLTLASFRFQWHHFLSEMPLSWVCQTTGKSYDYTLSMRSPASCTILVKSPVCTAGTWDWSKHPGQVL